MSTVSLKLQAKKNMKTEKRDDFESLNIPPPSLSSQIKDPTKQLNQRITKLKNIYDSVLYLFLIQERELFTTYMYVFFSGHK